MFVVDFIDLVFDAGGGRHYGFRVGAEHIVEFHHLRLDSLKRWRFSFLIQKMLMGSTIFTSILPSFSKWNDLFISLVDFDKTAVILLFINIFDFQFIRMHFKCKFSVLLSQFQVRTILLEVHNFIAIMDLKHSFLMRFKLNV